MSKWKAVALAVGLSGVLLTFGAAAPAVGERAGTATGSVRVGLLDVNGAATSSIVDGDTLTLRLELSEPANAATPAHFRLVLLPQGREVASCEIAKGSTSCSSEPIETLGWAWTEGGERSSAVRLALRSANDERSSGSPAGAPALTIELAVAPRPVVLVHGFSASAAAWASYLGPNGFLAGIGVDGYAVGDLNLGPAMNMGDPSSPTSRTNTVAENAAVLATAIDAVKRRSGATMVDLVAHSMGGLVARYYLSEVMTERDVSQLLMLGTPSLGSPCAALPAALGFYLPAALELRPSFLQHVFNPVVGGAADVPIEALAGVPITEPFMAPCTGVSSDLVVDVASVAAAGAPVTELPVLHTAQTGSQEAFQQFVAPRLRRAPGTFDVLPNSLISAAAGAQASHVYSGSVEPGSSVTLDIDLDAVAVAAFALYDPTTSLDLTVRGASGAEIELSAAANALVTIDDPTSLVHLGYGFNNPRPGLWRVTLTGGPDTPADGAPFAFAARLVGGASVVAAVDEILPLVGESVVISARLNDVQPDSAAVLAIITAPDGAKQTLVMQDLAGTWSANWQADETGVHGIDIVATGSSEQGLAVERTVSLAVQARAATERWWPRAVVVTLLGLFGLWLLSRFPATRR